MPDEFDKEHTPQTFDLTDRELRLLKDKTTENPGTLAYPHHSGSSLVKPEDKGKIKGRAVSSMHEQTAMQMQQIFEQIKLLRKQAETIQQRIELSERIYLAEMRFEPLIGKTYHLYQKEDGKDLLSLIGPNEWGRSKPFTEFLGTVKLLADHTWQVID
jgi:hypothetical protein